MKKDNVDDKVPDLALENPKYLDVFSE